MSAARVLPTSAFVSATRSRESRSPSPRSTISGTQRRHRLTRQAVWERCGSGLRTNALGTTASGTPRIWRHRRAGGTPPVTSVPSTTTGGSGSVAGSAMSSAPPLGRSHRPRSNGRWIDLITSAGVQRSGSDRQAPRSSPSLPRQPTLAGGRGKPTSPDEIRRTVDGAVGLDVAACLELRSLPVDRRHNSKIDRSHLAAWAAQVFEGGPVRNP
jgi:hypothetical protein